jgi:hypothetical protein
MQLKFLLHRRPPSNVTVIPLKTAEIPILKGFYEQKICSNDGLDHLGVGVCCSFSRGQS